jgi:hypothetical protein
MGICGKCREWVQFEEYFEEDDKLTGYEGPASLNLAVDCIARLQDIFNALQHNKTSEEHQVALFCGIERSLASVLSKVLLTSGTGGQGSGGSSSLQ